MKHLILLLTLATCCDYAIEGKDCIPEGRVSKIHSSLCVVCENGKWKKINCNEMNEPYIDEDPYRLMPIEEQWNVDVVRR